MGFCLFYSFFLICVSRIGERIQRRIEADHLSSASFPLFLPSTLLSAPPLVRSSSSKRPAATFHLQVQYFSKTKDRMNLKSSFHYNGFKSVFVFLFEGSGNERFCSEDCCILWKKQTSIFVPAFAGLKKRVVKSEGRGTCVWPQVEVSFRHCRELKMFEYNSSCWMPLLVSQFERKCILSAAY